MEGYFRKNKSYEEAVSEIKENTRLLAEKQRWKIKQLREAGWDIQRVDATEAFKAAMMTPLLPENGQNQARDQNVNISRTKMKVQEEAQQSSKSTLILPFNSPVRKVVSTSMPRKTAMALDVKLFTGKHMYK
ncbi:hypothetical protein K7X08_006733 [Anisodus acutangulus]|uniref:Uncharacterized protein n=1 Tax=Anisodus acutangulus TaxID=402998 RepID=A0A9Q1MW22_9SOLA|nr:hypothetical protein K7X08_006733 [Anisodus acutangulus]